MCHTTPPAGLQPLPNGNVSATVHLTTADLSELIKGTLYAVSDMLEGSVNGDTTTPDAILGMSLISRTVAGLVPTEFQLRDGFGKRK
ncbi:MAG: hypothetical protein AB8F78_17440 [Saprospiraceae bacterium]